MKLAEALIVRADLQTKIAQLQKRLEVNVKIQEGDAPSEKPDELFKELNNCINELESIIKKINKTNSATQINNKTISDIIAEKDMISKKCAIYQSICNVASNKIDRYSNKEIRIINTINIADIQKQADALSKKHREIDTLLQNTNWTKDLVE